MTEERMELRRRSWTLADDRPETWHLVEDDNYVGLVARDMGNQSAKNPWLWRITMADSVERITPLAGQSATLDGAKADAEMAYQSALRERELQTKA